MRLPVFIIIGLVSLAPVAHAQTPQAGWVADAKTGCRMWYLKPRPNDTFTWTGVCTRGVAQGKGVLRTYEGGKPEAVYEGEFRDGRLNGHSVVVWPDGTRYEGDFRDNLKSGWGIVQSTDGRRYEGEWKDDIPNGVGRYTNSNGTYNGVWTAGCFRDGNRRESVGVDLATCP